MKTFPLRSEKRKECPLRPLSFNIVLEILATVIRQCNYRVQIRKEEVKLSLFTDKMIL